MVQKCVKNVSGPATFYNAISETMIILINYYFFLKIAQSPVGAQDLWPQFHSTIAMQWLILYDVSFSSTTGKLDKKIFYFI